MIYFIATPIGNLEDITLRALKILRKTDVIVCEDTRHTSKLLNKYKIKNKELIPYNDFNKNDILDDLIFKAKKFDLSFVSDAGMPLISDTGYKFVKKILENNLKFTVLPGPTASLTALCLSGLKPDKFLFIGFLPKTKSKIISLLKSYKNTNASIIIYENKNRVYDTLKILNNIFGNKKTAIVREISKIYEEVISDNIEVLIKKFSSKQLKGEIVIILENFETKNVIDTGIENKIKELKTLNLTNKDIKNILKIFDYKKISYHDF